MIRPDPNRLELEEAIEKLGGVREEFRPATGNIMAARIIGPIIVVIGATVTFLILRSGRNLDPPTWYFLGFAGLLPIGSGIAFVIWSLWRSSYRLLLCNDGVIQVYRTRITAIRWENILGVDEVKAVLPSVGSSQRKTWTIHYRHSDGRQEMDFDMQSVSAVEKLMGLIREQTDRRNITWIEDQKFMG